MISSVVRYCLVAMLESLNVFIVLAFGSGRIPGEEA